MEATLAREVLGSLALEDPQIGSAQAQGLLIGEVNRKSKFHADLSNVAVALAARLQLEAS